MEGNLRKQLGFAGRSRPSLYADGFGMAVKFSYAGRAMTRSMQKWYRLLHDKTLLRLL